MTPTQQIDLAKVILTFVQSLLWPAVVIFLVFRFGEPLRRFLGALGELTFKAGGVEATARKQQQAEAASSLFADLENKIRANLESEAIVHELKRIASVEAGKRAEEEVTKYLASVADRTVETIRKENFITVDSRPLVGPDGPEWELPASQFATVSEFLDNLWYLLKPWDVIANTYGIKWILRNAETNDEIRNIGRSYARRFGAFSDTRSLVEVGLRPGMRLEAVPLG